tara:strand:+ start:101 stop:295 length:195 start_codon:yes stop_codon:yes gene_type:complete
MILRLDPPNPTHFMRSFKLAIPVFPLGTTHLKISLKRLMDNLLRLKTGNDPQDRDSVSCFFWVS